MFLALICSYPTFFLCILHFGGDLLLCKYDLYGHPDFREEALCVINMYISIKGDSWDARSDSSEEECGSLKSRVSF